MFNHVRLGIKEERCIAAFSDQNQSTQRPKDHNIWANRGHPCFYKNEMALLMSVSMLTRVSSQPSELAQPARISESRGHAPFKILYNVSFMSLLFGLSSVQLAEQVFPKQFPSDFNDACWCLKQCRRLQWNVDCGFLACAIIRFPEMKYLHAISATLVCALKQCRRHQPASSLSGSPRSTWLRRPPTANAATAATQHHHCNSRREPDDRNSYPERRVRGL